MVADDGPGGQGCGHIVGELDLIVGGHGMMNDNMQDLLSTRRRLEVGNSFGREQSPNTSRKQICSHRRNCGQQAQKEAQGQSEFFHGFVFDNAAIMAS
jgi:hypothetical protein